VPLPSFKRVAKSARQPVHAGQWRDCGKPIPAGDKARDLA
jgi:hypothetical protein